MDSIKRLEEIFSHFPGIGPRQARRFVYHILSRSQSTISEFQDLIAQVKKLSRECSRCYRFHLKDNSDSPLCNICRQADREHSTLMILARDSDFESVEKSGVYKGVYFILGGTVPILDKEPEKRIRLRKLLERVSGSPEIKEIILSLNTTADGEHTEDIVKEALQKMNLQNIKITILGRGLSTGAELEYADQETIKNALLNRH